ncbi:MAG: Asp-tRNA(Asn)/Glu-tRNA(Gln) amidotransferase subunit GatB [Patescibacteria group bacterium]
MDNKLLEQYEPTIGLEIHVQLATKTKMFCRCDNDSEGVAPNTNVCEVCMGYPGTLPVTNQQAIEYGTKLAKALGCEINQFQRFDRKNYFYPDLPKGYQISQFFFPVGEHGTVEVDYLMADRKSKGEFKVGITRLHLEEDAGKLTHGKEGSLVDLNRCGTPLAEIVTEPDIHSPEEARAFMYELQRIVRALGVSAADMEKGNLRVDGNISVRKRGATELGDKVEIKNLNSFKFLEQALNFEIERQIGLLEAGEKVVQETRGWDEKSNTTISQRIKEGSVDYRYFPEPDLPPIEISNEELGGMIAEMEMLPGEMRIKAERLGIPYSRVDELQGLGKLPWVIEIKEANPDVDVMVLTNWAGQDWEDMEQLAKFAGFVADKKLSGFRAQQLFDAWKADMKAELKQILSSLGEEMDESDLEAKITEVLEANPDKIEEFKGGKDKLMGFFVGQVMAKVGNSAEPAKVKEVLERLLTK